MVLVVGYSAGMNVIRSFFASIDSFIYKLIGTIYDMTIDITNIVFFGNNENAVVNLGDFTRKVYLLLGVFMVFKISFSFIRYLLNPEDFIDNGKGVQKLVQNVVLVLIMLIAVPWAFDKLYEIQRAILEDKVIERFIFEEGDSGRATVGVADNPFAMSEVCRWYENNECESPRSDDCQYKGAAASSGDYIALTLFKPFYQYNTELFDYQNAADDDEVVIPAGYCSLNENMTIDSFLSHHILDDSTTNSWFATEEDMYYIDYNFFLSTIVGIVGLLFMLSITFDVVIRCLKLGVLQMIAPIPIISYIDPAKGKNGMLTKYLKEVGMTWASVFIRLATLYFAVFIISKLDLLSSLDIVSEKSLGYRIWLNIIFVLGALMFAKQFPSWLEGILGIKMGKLQLNPFSRIKSDVAGYDNITKYGKKAAVGVGAAGLAGAGFLMRQAGARKDAKEKAKKANEELQTKINNRSEMIDRLRAQVKTPGDQAMLNHRIKNLAQLQQKYKQQYKQSYEKNLNKTKEKFSYGHAGIAGAATIARAGMAGYKQGAAKPSEIGKNIASAAQAAAKTTNYHDDMSIIDRIKDFGTDISGRTNESGGTGAVKGEIKKLTDQMKGLERALETKNDILSNTLQNYYRTNPAGQMDFVNSFTSGAGGMYEYNANSLSEEMRRIFLPIVQAINEDTKALNDINKEIKKKQSFVDKKK